jgi:hypothetical protein
MKMLTTTPGPPLHTASGWILERTASAPLGSAETTRRMMKALRKRRKSGGGGEIGAGQAAPLHQLLMLKSEPAAAGMAEMVVEEETIDTLTMTMTSAGASAEGDSVCCQWLVTTVTTRNNNNTSIMCVLTTLF